MGHQRGKKAFMTFLWENMKEMDNLEDLVVESKKCTNS